MEGPELLVRDSLNVAGPERSPFTPSVLRSYLENRRGSGLRGCLVATAFPRLLVPLFPGGMESSDEGLRGWAALSLNPRFTATNSVSLSKVLCCCF